MSSKSFPYRFGILCSLSVVFFLYQRVFSKNCCGFSTSKHVEFLAKKCFAKSRSKYGKIRTTVQIRVLTDRMSTNQNVYLLQMYIYSNLFLDNQRPKSASLRSLAVRDGKCTVDVFVSCGEPFVPLEGKYGILYI